MMIQIVSKWWIEHVMNDGIHVYWDVYCVVSYKLCNHTTVRHFKGEEFCATSIMMWSIMGTRRVWSQARWVKMILKIIE